MTNDFIRATVANLTVARDAARAEVETARAEAQRWQQRQAVAAASETMLDRLIAEFRSLGAGAPPSKLQ